MLKVRKIRLQSELLDWYDAHKRVMPWRAVGGCKANPYHVWMSEVMLQQTTVVTVVSYFNQFIKKWPKVTDLACSNQDEVLASWAGLGYYARARNLYKCAGIIAQDYKGKFPETEEELIKLPGIGPYTAAAISSIAFDRPAVAVDGNVERVVSRFFAIEEPMPKSKATLKEHAVKLAQGNVRAGDFTQAFMELGATVCTPRNPKCDVCPWQKSCQAHKQGIAETLPRKLPKKKKPVRYGKVYWVERKDGKFLIHKRPETGLYASMYQLPTCSGMDGLEQSHGLDGKLSLLAANLSVQHSFTHFDLVLEVLKVSSPVLSSVKKEVEGGVWVGVDELERYALPTLMKKAIRLCAV